MNEDGALLNSYLKTKKKFPPELALLIRLLGAANHQEAQKHSKLFVDAEIDWSLFAKLVIHRHRVTGQIYGNLTQFAGDSVPETVLNVLRIHQQRNIWKMMEKTAELSKLLALFSEKKIRALPFKGPTLGVQLYGDICTRYANDIDIVIPLNDLSLADSLLRKSGYNRISPLPELSKKQFQAFTKKNKHYNYLHADKKITLELHWNFFQDFSCPLTFDDFWKNRKTLEIGGEKVSVCSFEDNLTALLVHGGNHFWRRLFWLLDILLIVKGFSASDWKNVMRRSEQLGISRITVSTIVLLEELFNLQAPVYFHTAVKKDPVIQFIVNSSMASILMSDEQHTGATFSFAELKTTLSTFFLVPALRYKAAYIVKRLSPGPKDYKYLRLPDRFFFLYYLFKPILWVHKRTINRFSRSASEKM